MDFSISKLLYMPSNTPGYAKNIIRRAFRQVIDEHPSREDIDAIWKYFESECAYCGVKLQRAKKEGHLDHLVAASSDGSNHLSNRVLSCATCNEGEKRDLHWEKFLAAKICDPILLEKRRKRILAWQDLHGGKFILRNAELDNLANDLARQVVEYFELQMLKLKIAKEESLRSLK